MWHNISIMLDGEQCDRLNVYFIWQDLTECTHDIVCKIVFDIIKYNRIFFFGSQHRKQQSVMIFIQMVVITYQLHNYQSMKYFLKKCIRQVWSLMNSILWILDNLSFIIKNRMKSYLVALRKLISLWHWVSFGFVCFLGWCHSLYCIVDMFHVFTARKTPFFRRYCFHLRLYVVDVFFLCL